MGWGRNASAVSCTLHFKGSNCKKYVDTDILKMVFNNKA